MESSDPDSGTDRPTAQDLERERIREWSAKWDWPLTNAEREYLDADIAEERAKNERLFWRNAKRKAERDIDKDIRESAVERPSDSVSEKPSVENH